LIFTGRDPSFAMKIKSLRDLFLHELRDLYSAEKQLLKALPKMAKAATHEELQEAFEEHLGQTEEQVQRLEQVFEALGEKPKAEKCLAMEGLIAEAQNLLKEDMPAAVLDAALIGAAQKVEHYEIAGYGTVRTFAEMLDEDEAVDLLEQTLEEEKETDARLTEIAESLVNTDAETVQE
jgi:ferritin-like metal-binding protein YciE